MNKIQKTTKSAKYLKKPRASEASQIIFMKVSGLPLASNQQNKIFIKGLIILALFQLFLQA